MAYQYPLNGGRINASVSGNSTSVGAGYQLVSTGTLVLAGGNNVTLNQNANSISIAGPSLSNSNGFTFGTNGSVVTASYAGGGSVNFSAGTTSSNLASVNLSNANGVSFGLNGGTITASHNALTSQSAQALSASNGSFAFQTAGFSNANGVTFGTSAGSIMTASVNTSYAASNHSHGNPTLNLTNLSGTTASASNGLTLSLSASSQSVQTIGGYAAGNTTGQSSSTTFDARSMSVSATGGVSAGYSAGVLQISAPAASSMSVTGALSMSVNGSTVSLGVAAQTNQSLGLYASSNTVTNATTSGTVDARSLTFQGVGNASVGISNGSVIISASGGAGGGGIALANSQTTYTSGTANLVGSGAISVNSTAGQSYVISAPAQSNLSATGAVSISNNGNTISIGAPAFSAGMSTGGNTLGTTGTVSNQLIFAGGNNITLSQSTGVGGNTISIIGGAGGGGGGLALSANALISSGTASLAASGALTASVNGQTLNLSVPATSSLVGVNGITISTNGGTISISGNGGGGGGAVGRWEHPTAVFTTLPAIVNNSLSLQHVYMPFNFSGTEMKIGGSLSMGTHTSASTGSATINLKMGIYTLSGSTLSLLNSGSYSTGFGVSSNSTSSYNGMRQFAVTGSFNLSAGEYWVGAILSTATNYASNPLGYTVYGNSAAPTAASAAILSPFGSAVTASPRDVFLFQGMYGTTTTALPTAIQGSQINNSAASFVQRAQFYHAIYSATY